MAAHKSGTECLKFKACNIFICSILSARDEISSADLLPPGGAATTDHGPADQRSAFCILRIRGQARSSCENEKPWLEKPGP
jgi:hypothetical protein